MPSRNGSHEARRSPWKFGGLTIKQLVLDAWQGITADNVMGRAGELAYFFFFAIFPLAIFMTTLLGVFAGPDSSIVKGLTDNVTHAMPASAANLVRQTMQTALSASRGGKMGFGFVLALLSAASGISAMMDTLNLVFGVREGRSLVKQRGVAVGLTIAVGALICVAISLVVVGGNFAHAFAGGVLYWVWNIVQYPMAIFFLLFSYSVIYYFAPNVEHPEWHWVTPGAVVGVVLWIIVSFGLRVYLHFFNSYSATYGALGAVMILLLWFYVTGLAILTGGEINAAIERAGTGQTKQQEPPEHRPASKIEREKTQRQEQQEVKPERAA